MKYFSNGRDRAIGRRVAVSRLEWYDSKVASYSRLMLTNDPAYFEAQYFEYVRDRQVLVDYLAALDAEDLQEGSLVVSRQGSSPDQSNAVVRSYDEVIMIACQIYAPDYDSLTSGEQLKIISEAKAWHLAFGPFFK